MKNILKYFPYKSLSAYAVLLTYSAVLIGNMTYQRWTVREVIDWDVTSYYGYLPATFIHNDIELKFVSEDPVGYAKRMEFWPETAENGGKVIKTTMGLSILYSPFFAIAHCIATYGGYSTTGFSAPYQLCIHFASVFYLAFGLIYLRKMLLMLFSETISAIVIVSIVLGTNLFYYATIEASMSHSFNFSLISIFLYLSFKWHERQKLSYTLMIGLIGGLIVLIRPVNIIVFIIPALMNVTSLTTLVRKFQFFWGYRSKILIIMGVAFAVCLPQMLYWKYITGHFFFHSYVGEHFFFNNPHILEGLFSYRKGWLLYSPIMAFSLVGLYSCYKIRRDLFWGVLVFTIVCLYVVFSWWCWWYGGGFGQRPLIDFGAIFAIPMAALFQQCLDSSSLLFKYGLIPVAALLIWFSLFKTDQYFTFRIHYDAMTKESYWMHFLQGRENVDWHRFENSLRTPDYDKAIKGEDEYEFKPF